MSDKHRISELETLIRKYQASYYNGEGEIPDEDFDLLWDELKDLDPSNPLLHKVGADNSNGFVKRKHVIPMGSQEKAADPDEFIQWANKQNFRTFITEFKMDGASIELQYVKGKFTYAVTRGDGEFGDDITANVRKMNGVVMDLKSDFTGGIRGEVLMSHEIHQKHFSDKANCRNAANGLMKRRNGEGSEHLDIIVYDAIHSSKSMFSDEISKLKWLKSVGFSVVEFSVIGDVREVIGYRDQIMKTRSNLRYDIDGLVIKNNIINAEDMKRDRPQQQIAFKFTLQEAASVLREVIWSVSGLTRTPIAVCDPVRLAGTTVNRANLCNTHTINELGIRVGSTVILTKRGEIIPKIERVVETPDTAIPIPVPTICDFCGSRIADLGTVVKCTNQKCPQRTIHQIEKWIDTMDIQNLGLSSIQKLYDVGILTSISSLYKLTVYKISAVDRMGDKIAEKIIQSINDNRAVTLAKFISGFDIDGIGETVIQMIVDAGFNSFEVFVDTVLHRGCELTKIRGIGATTINAIIVGLNESLEEMRYMIDHDLIELIQTSEGKLTGKSFCFTGELVAMKRAKAEQLVKSLGGTIKGSVTSDLTYLVTNNPNSSSGKNQKAKELNIQILDEEKFMSLI